MWRKRKTRLNWRGGKDAAAVFVVVENKSPSSPVVNVDIDDFPALFLCSIPYLFDLDQVRVVELELTLGTLRMNGEFVTKKREEKS